MDKHIFAAVLLDKTKAFAVVKPLYFAFCQLYSPPFIMEILCQMPKEKGKNRNSDPCLVIFFQVACTGNRNYILLFEE